MFHFKQFSVNQAGCAMKINTDGVLLGALIGADNPLTVLDIGTGTGVIALMLAQRYLNAKIDAVEIDSSAAIAAENNFKISPFNDRLSLYPIGFDEYFTQFPEKKYNLVVANPPFYIDCLLPTGSKKNLAKHAGDGFFERLIKAVSSHLDIAGVCWLVLPLSTAELVRKLARDHQLYLSKIIHIHSFKEDVAHRQILVFGLTPRSVEEEDFIIYDEQKVYSRQYQETLKNYLTIF